MSWNAASYISFGLDGVHAPIPELQEAAMLLDSLPHVLSARPPSSTAASGDPTARTLWFLCGRILDNEPMRYIPIHDSPFVIGRKPSCSLCLPSYAVSSLHAEAVVDSRASLMLRDLGSTNGTFVNGRRVSHEEELASGDLVNFATSAFRVLRQTAAVDNATSVRDVCDEAMSLVLFDRLIAEEAVIPHYQPIVDLRSGDTIGHEVLVRSSLAGLETPGRMFSAAAQLNLEIQLSRMIRAKAVTQTREFPEPPHLFLNTHPVELDQPGLVESMQALRELHPSQPITLEIHEGAVTDAASIIRLRDQLRELNVKLAFDDFGAGQARLVELADVHPDFLKFDMALIRSIHTASPDHQKLVGALVGIVREMGITSLAEGVETAEEAAVCTELGFDLAQGYYFGRPCPLQKFSS